MTNGSKPALKGEPAVILGTIVAIISAVLATVPSLPDSVQAVLIAVVSLAGALGIRSQVKPTLKGK